MPPETRPVGHVVVTLARSARRTAAWIALAASAATGCASTTSDVRGTRDVAADAAAPDDAAPDDAAPDDAAREDAAREDAAPDVGGLDAGAVDADARDAGPDLDVAPVVDAAVSADALPPECPPSPPRPGMCPREMLRCTYPNGCTFRCSGAGTARLFWYTTAGCFPPP